MSNSHISILVNQLATGTLDMHEFLDAVDADLSLMMPARSTAPRVTVPSSMTSADARLGRGRHAASH